MKALGLPRRGNCLLAAEIRADDGSLKGVRPLGGSVAFGERAADALIREFEEEVGITVTVLGGPHVMENIFTHEGQVGHEVLFLFPVALPPDWRAGQDRVEFREDCGTACVARWCDLDGLDGAGGPELFPTGLKAWLRGAWDGEPRLGR